ncbi:MAG: hypothetical protein ACE5R6_19080 [Candidatus Heimdallarchaeota archaeon]
MGSRQVVYDFIQKLSSRAHYGLRGEKPLAIIATLEYVRKNKLYGKTLLELIDNHNNPIRNEFLEVANRFGRLSNPNNSWSVITGPDQELQNAIKHHRLVNQAFTNLTADEVNELLKSLYQRLEKLSRRREDKHNSFNTANTSQAQENHAQEIVEYSFKGAKTILGMLLNEIREVIKSSTRRHNEIISSFRRRGWNTEVSLLASYRCDVYKDYVAIEVESTDKSSVIDVLHRNFFRFWILYRMKKIKAAILITSYRRERSTSTGF